ncbi:MAG: FMN-binding protein [Lachnospiraceae bacterium]|nr:FMN-binding protein [Lachnospiraceae bacterium]
MSDGTYVGEYKGIKDNSRDTMVEITISDGNLVQIKAVGGAFAEGKQANEISGGKSLDNLFNSVMENQTLNVDAISGATLTSKSYLKAVENALSEAQSR